MTVLLVYMLAEMQYLTEMSILKLILIMKMRLQQ